jgi:hypothetical protein
MYSHQMLSRCIYLKRLEVLGSCGHNKAPHKNFLARSAVKGIAARSAPVFDGMLATLHAREGAT